GPVPVPAGKPMRKSRLPRSPATRGRPGRERTASRVGPTSRACARLRPPGRSSPRPTTDAASSSPPPSRPARRSSRSCSWSGSFLSGRDLLVRPALQQVENLPALPIVELSFLDQVDDQSSRRAVEEMLDQLAEQARDGRPATDPRRPQITPRPLLPP